MSDEDDVFDQFVDWGEERGEGMGMSGYITKQPFSSERVAPSFADTPNEHDRKIINSLPKREFSFILVILVTLHIFETYQLYTDWVLWWSVFLIENFIMLKVVTGYPRYGGVDALIMLPFWIPFHLIYIGVCWVMVASFAYLQVSWLFGFIGALASGFALLFLHIPMFWLQVSSWRVYP